MMCGPDAVFVRRSILAVVILGLGFRVAGVAAQTEPSPSTCEGTEIRVVGATPAEFKDVCQGVLAARRFLLSKGLVREPELTVEVTARLPEVVGPEAAGCFIQDRNRAYVLAYEAFLKKRTWFGIPISRTLYRSLATHETAHAVAGCNFVVKEPSIQAKEYIAYVTMFSTMPENLRVRALKFLPGTGFSDIDRVSSIVYLFDPMRFGAQAYRHFVGLEDGAAFLRDVMSGRALSD